MLGRLRPVFLAGMRLGKSVTSHNIPRKPLCCDDEVMMPLLRHFSNENSWRVMASEKTSCHPLVKTLDEIVEDICNGDADEEKKLRVLMLEVEVMRQDGRRAPDHITRNEWAHLLSLPTKSQRVNYLTFLFKNEKTNEHKKEKKQKRKEELELYGPKKEKEFPDDMEYGLSGNAMFIRIRDQSMNSFDNYRAHLASIYGTPLVIDCSYDEDMVLREVLNAGKQLMLLMGDNRVHREPFDIHMCNCDFSGHTMKTLQSMVPPIQENWFPMHLHEQSYLKVFPKDKLVYLTPHCHSELTAFDPDAVYIIGAMVDKKNSEPLSLAKAKRDGIKMARLPLDRYVEWAPGSGKSLNINHMVNILLDLQVTGDWKYSLRHIPKRKLMATKLESVKRNVARYNPKFIESLRNPGVKKKTRFDRIPVRAFAGKLNVRSLMDDDKQY